MFARVGSKCSHHMSTSLINAARDVCKEKQYRYSLSSSQLLAQMASGIEKPLQDEGASAMLANHSTTQPSQSMIHSTRRSRTVWPVAGYIKARDIHASRVKTPWPSW